MPQALLPLIPSGATEVNSCLSVIRAENKWIYFYGVQPVFSHGEDDQRSFRMFSSQLVCQGICTQAEIVRTFGVSKNSVKRSVKKYREEGIEGFYSRRKGRGPSIMTDRVKEQAQELLDSGMSRKEVAEILDVKYDTLRKAIETGRIHEPSPVKKKSQH